MGKSSSTKKKETGRASVSGRNETKEVSGRDASVSVSLPSPSSPIRDSPLTVSSFSSETDSTSLPSTRHSNPRIRLPPPIVRKDKPEDPSPSSSTSSTSTAASSTSPQWTTRRSTVSTVGTLGPPTVTRPGPLPSLAEESSGQNSEEINEISNSDLKDRRSTTDKRPSGGASALKAMFTGGVNIKKEIGRAVQQECRDRSRMPSSA
eukprot:TRINITY_DN9957_c0_g1_i6.p1 TRINITY_DN9957_c0_g1~~TRINITY_DN9957_c0_g1_i6.p1  ORF type:complete len:206 (-),score=23.92 TRINITY_DN9957_c0_g1_i6:10-627(-)